MISELERKILNKLKTLPNKRRLDLEKIHNELSEVYHVLIPNTIIPALDHLILNLDPKNPEAQGIVVEAELKRNLRRQFIKARDINAPYYVISFFNVFKSVFRAPREDNLPKNIPATIDIRLNEATVNFDFEGENISRKILPPDGFFTYKSIKLKGITDLLCVEVRPLSHQRRADFRKKVIRRSFEDRGTVLIYVHNNEDTYMYNLFAEMVMTPLPSTDLFRQRVYRKALGYLQESDKFDRGEYIEKVKRYLVSKWLFTPGKFDNFGITIPISFSQKTHTDPFGRYLFSFNEGSKERDIINVGRNYKNVPCHVEQKGRIILIYVNDEIINGYKVKNIGYECRVLDPTPESSEYVKIKNVDFGKKETNFFILNKRARFKTEDIARQYRTNDQDVPYAIMGHIIDDQASFELLVKPVDQELFRKEITPVAFGRRFDQKK